MFRFPRFSLYPLSPLLAAVVVALSACSSPKPKFQDDQLLSSAPNQFSRSFSYASGDACEASRRALLSQGYMTTLGHDGTVDASKNFQPESDSHIVVEIHVVCTDGDATNTSMVYVNAVQNGFALKKSDTSASVGLSILGSVSLPIRSNSDAMVKISSETIQSSKFYDRFFELVGNYLGAAARSEAVPDAGKIKVTPLPPPVTVPAAAPHPAAPDTAATAASADPASLLRPVAAGVTPQTALAPVTAPHATGAAVAASDAAAATHVAATSAAAPAAASATTLASTPAITAAPAPAAQGGSSTAGASATGSSNATTGAAPASATPATP
ncbi:MAG: DUF2242 domain-containing protein [Paraburkholderia sp.]|uniref:DUF2242 domain-containing protein n=1 Tax=Paraburkholderia sp. TaxID=1926495 RepID=UPI00121EAF9F|nr:DUF2242 domain-containing protein [Paraburkholderia sp.]TAM02935.1 MAG: DUF2242 domain-containing protein [Paraburkholderia sp.]TAM29345.1 MAG: DUF2242 domain-containing protein [Paraburkholderia sp.]